MGKREDRLKASFSTIADLTTLAEEHRLMESILTDILINCCNPYCTSATPEECKEIIERNRQKMIDLLWPDFDDAR